MTVDEQYEEFKPLSEAGFHINSVVALLGFILSLLLCFRAYHEWHECCQCKQEKYKKPPTNKKNTPSRIIYASLFVLISSVFLFLIYCIEFFWFRIFPPNDSFQFCILFTPFLFMSAWLLACAIIHYFLIRLQHSFKGSALEYSKYLYIILRVTTVIVVVMSLLLVLIGTDGLPYSVKTQQVTNDNPWLCRNGIKSRYKFFWILTNTIGLIVVVGGNFMNWYLFMNRLSKLIELGLTHDDSFKVFYSKKRKRYQSIDNGEEHITPIHDTDEEQLQYPQDTAIGFRNTSTAATRVSSNSMRVMQILDKAIAKRKHTEDEKEKRKQRRAARQRRLYTLIKRQSILTGIVSISGAILWMFQIALDEGSTMTLLSVIISVVCVYLSFGFNIRRFDFCCGKCMDNCTCIEDYMERKVAEKMGLATLAQETTLEIVSEKDDILQQDPIASSDENGDNHSELR